MLPKQICYTQIMASMFGYKTFYPDFALFQPRGRKKKQGQSGRNSEFATVFFLMSCTKVVHLTYINIPGGKFSHGYTQLHRRLHRASLQTSVWRMVFLKCSTVGNETLGTTSSLSSGSYSQYQVAHIWTHLHLASK